MNSKAHYGYVVMRPELYVELVPPQPLPWHLSAYYKMAGVIDDMKAPFYLAVSVTFFRIAFGLH
jgi:hypothetical protein